MGIHGAVVHSKQTEETMLDPKKLEDIGNKMNALLANSPAKDFEKNAKALMSGFLAKLDLVTREEFDIQAQVLARTREKLKELEARVEALEKARAGQ
jgi:BMFP domain-containing protein YqiC